MDDGTDLPLLDHQQPVHEILIRRFNPHFRGFGDALLDGGAVGFGSLRHGGSLFIALLLRDT
ncbi:hypothetical protein, partial [Pseudomonas sp. DC1.2]|uniref:hypothetical protein n=1 Tax=Pseudomonas sp. DC1.2 TaxID=3048622 RepID=UPI002B238A1A